MDFKKCNIGQKKKVKVFILVTGSHLSKQFGITFREIEKDGLKKYYKKKYYKKKLLRKDISNYISQAIESASEILDKIKPEKIVILG